MKAYLTAALLLLPVSATAQEGLFQKQVTLSAAEAALRTPPPADPSSLIEMLRWQVLDASNRERARVGLPPLTSNPLLDQVAARYSRKMRDLNFFDHVAPDGENLDQRLPATEKWRFEALGENLWTGQGALDWRSSYISTQAAENWVESPGHRANLFEPSYTVAGVGSAMRGDEIYITMLYATPVSDPETAILQRDFGDAPADLTGFAAALENSLANTLNSERARVGLPPLRTESNLTQNAKSNAQNALYLGGSATGILDEVFRLDPSRSGRLAAGFWRGSGALIWQAEAVAMDIVERWLRGQTGADALDPNFSDVGFGVASDGNAIQVTVVFGETS